MACYDYDYIDKKIIGGVEKNLPAVSDTMRYVERKATGKIVSQLSSSALNMTKHKDAGEEEVHSQSGHDG